jgi:diguanylate cyclase
MQEFPMSDAQNPIFVSDSLEQAGEIFRLAVPVLSKNGLPATPVNFSLLYHYMSGRDLRLKEKLDEFLEEGKDWNQDERNDLFLRFLFRNDETMMEGLRSELLAVVAEVLGSLVDLAGKATISSSRLENHVDQLADSQNVQGVLKVVSSIVAETRTLIAETNSLESQLKKSSGEVMRMKDELKRTRREALIDQLTEVGNRRSFDRNMKELVQDANGNGSTFSFLLLDIDYFKNINDTYGHLVGDRVLKSIARLLIKYTKGKDKVSRYGGEEFAILLPETSFGNARSVAESIRKNIEKVTFKLPKSSREITDLTISIGVAGYHKNEAVERLIERCDAALYRAKQQGRNRVIGAD